MSYESESTTSPVYTGPAKLIYPFLSEGDAATKQVNQKYNVRAGSYAAPTLNEAYNPSGTDLQHGNFMATAPTIGTAYLLYDTEPTEAETGLVEFTRKWSNIPATRYEYTTFAANFPGLAYGGVSERRYPFIKSVALQTTYEYYLTGTGGSYATPDLIPVVAATSFRYSTDSVDRQASDIFLSGSTTPTAATWITDVGTAAFTYVVEPSTVERYMGNIYVRVTKKVRPL